MKCYYCGGEVKMKVWVNQDGVAVGKPFGECTKCGARQ